MSKIVIIDYDMGNLSSVEKIFAKYTEKILVTNNLKDILSADKIVLPGVGHCLTGMQNLNKLNLISTIKEAALILKKPFLGICVGMQILSKYSEEGECECLGLLEATTKKFTFSDNSLKIPHVGWNFINIKKESLLVKNLNNLSKFYFTHSYYVDCINNDDIIATTNYGFDFPTIIQHENIFAAQFHPEKSHSFGLTLIKNFVEV